MDNANARRKRLSPTVYYLLTGMVLGWPGLLATGLLLPDWQRGATLSPLSLATIHLLVLGSMLTVAFGVLYQIIPIAFQAPPMPRHVLYWHLPVHVASVLTMVVGFLTMRFVVVGIGGAMLLCGAIAFFAFVGRRYLRARNKTVVHRGLALPLTSLWLVMGLGLYQALVPGRITQPVVLTHVLIGGLAFWGGLVLVFSYKLIPMFTVSHGYQASFVRSAFLYYGGVAMKIAALWTGTPAVQQILGDAAGLVIVCGLLSYAVDMIFIVRARKRRHLAWPLFDALFAIACFVFGQAGIVLAVTWPWLGWMFPSIYVFGFGGLMGLMFSFMQKIVPFLWFEYRFSKRPERKTAPPIDDMVAHGTAQSGMLLYGLGVMLGFAGFVSHGAGRVWLILDWASAIGLTVGSVTLFVALRRVLTIGGTRPTDET